MTNYLNSYPVPNIGQHWVFQDTQIELQPVEWVITRQPYMPEGLGDVFEMVKLDGRDVGYTALVALSRFKSRFWTLKEGEEAEMVVEWNCPVCDKPNPIPEGDYKCLACRS